MPFRTLCLFHPDFMGTKKRHTHRERETERRKLSHRRFPGQVFWFHMSGDPPFSFSTLPPVQTRARGCQRSSFQLSNETRTQRRGTPTREEISSWFGTTSTHQPPCSVLSQTHERRTRWIALNNDALAQRACWLAGWLPLFELVLSCLP